MGRPVAIRVSYGDDASFLIRLSKAVSNDERRSLDWRKKTCQKIDDLAIHLLEASKGDDKTAARSRPEKAERRE